MDLRRLTAVAALLAVAACEGGTGLPRQQPGETYPGERRAIEGTIEVGSDGCVRLRLDDGTTYLTIWPASASEGRDDYVNLGWFQKDLGTGDRIVGTGAITPLADLPHWIDGYWHVALGWCAARGTDTEALVLDLAKAAGG